MLRWTDWPSISKWVFDLTSKFLHKERLRGDSSSIFTFDWQQEEFGISIVRKERLLLSGQSSLPAKPGLTKTIFTYKSWYFPWNVSLPSFDSKNVGSYSLLLFLWGSSEVWPYTILIMTTHYKVLAGNNKPSVIPFMITMLCCTYFVCVLVEIM